MDLRLINNKYNYNMFIRNAGKINCYLLRYFDHINFNIVKLRHDGDV